MFSLGHLGSVLQYCLQFKATHPEFPEKVPYATRFVLHEHQALLETKLRSYIVAAEGIEDHRSSAHHQFQNLKDFGTHLPYGHTVIHVDYKQSPTIPFGPDETGSWWFATARRSVIVFGAHILADSATPTEEEPCFFLHSWGLFSTIRWHFQRRACGGPTEGLRMAWTSNLWPRGLQQASACIQDNILADCFLPDPTAFPSEGVRRAYGGPAEGLDLKFVARGLQQGSVCNQANEAPFPRE